MTFAQATPQADAAADLLATVQHLLRQIDLRGGELAPDQIEALRASADRARAANREASRAPLAA